MKEKHGNFSYVSNNGKIFTNCINLDHYNIFLLGLYWATNLPFITALLLWYGEMVMSMAYIVLQEMKREPPDPV